MAAPYLALTEPVSQESACNGRYNRKVLVVVALASGLGSVLLLNQLARGEQQSSTTAMYTLPTMQQIGSRLPSVGSWRSTPMHSAGVSRSSFLQPVNAEAAAAKPKPKPEAAAAKPKPKPKAKPKPTPAPFDLPAVLAEIDQQLKNPEKIMVKFGGSTGGLMRKSFEEEMYIMTWDNPAGERIFEMPTAGAAIMNAGPNMVYLSRKEHGIALGTAFRSKFKIKQYKIFRRMPNGEIQFIHPADGVFPEKVNAGRVGANQMQGGIR